MKTLARAVTLLHETCFLWVQALNSQPEISIPSGIFFLMKTPGFSAFQESREQV